MWQESGGRRLRALTTGIASYIADDAWVHQ
jgi:hypothetical protein